MILHFTGFVTHYKVIPVVVVVISSLTVDEDIIRVSWVERMVSSNEPEKRFKIFCVYKIKLQNLMQRICFLCVFFVTRLKGDLTEHHPDVSKVKAAAQGLGPAAVERHSHVACARVFVVQHRLEYHRLRLPAGNEAGLKPTGDGGKDLHATNEHVVTVNLKGQMGLSVCRNNL